AQTARARSRVETKLAQNPDDVGLLLLAANTYKATGDFSRSEQTLSHLVDIDPTNPQAHALRGRLFMSQQKLESAGSEFEIAAERESDSESKIAAQTMVALILEAQDRPSDAQRRYEQILAASPRSFVAANNLAWLYAQHGGNLDVALGLAQTAVQRAPDQPQVNDTLGWIYYKKDLPGQAIAALRRSVEKDSTNPIYHYHLALAYSQGGDRARAKELLERALALDPQFEGSTDARKLLVSLGG